MKQFFSLRFSWIIGSSITLLCGAITSPKIWAGDVKEGECVCSPQQTSKAFTAVAKKTMPAVLFITAQTNLSDQEDYNNPHYQNPFDFNEEFFNRFFGGAPRQQKPQPQMSQGSGFLVSTDGYIMTNAHVVKGADKLSVVLHDGREMEATLVGADPHTDIAVIKIEGKDFPFLSFGDSEQIEVGEWAVAIGSPFQLEASLTVGVISARGRQNLRIADFEDFIQTDAAINPGNSGGPLLNLDGQVIGINTAIASRTGGSMGIGFAIPSNMAKYVMDQIIEKGIVIRGFLGVSLQPVDKDIADAFNLSKPEGALVSDVVKDSPADKAGLKQGDIILECNKIPIKSLHNFRKDISMMNPGSTVKLKINRRGEILNIPVALGSASDNASSEGVIQKLGMEIDNLTADLAKQLGYSNREEGVVIIKVKPGSSAARSGLRPGFLIQEVNYRKVTSVSDFNEALSQTKDKHKRALFLVRQGNATPRYYSVKIE